MTENILNELPKGPWATFHLANETFAVSADDVQEVMIQQPLTPVPLAPRHVIGLLNLRGQIMPAIDLRCRLMFPAKQDDTESSYMVIKTQDSLFSIVVDSIGDVLDLKPGSWELPPETLAPAHKNFVFGICSVGAKVLLGLKAQSLSGDLDERDNGVSK